MGAFANNNVLEESAVLPTVLPEFTNVALGNSCTYTVIITMNFGPAGTATFSHTWTGPCDDSGD